MKTKQTRMTRLTAALALALALTGTTRATAQTGDQAPAISERVAAMRVALIKSKVNLKAYEWIETTVVSLKGEEKSKTQERCYHGADGKVQKLPISESPEPDKKRGIRGRIAEKKKEELSDSMKQAIALVRQYLPPDPDAIQKAKEAGKASIAILDPGKRVRVEFKDYLMPGDQMQVEVTLTDNHLNAINISTFLEDKNTDEKKKDPVTLAVRMGTLEDGSTYAAVSTLEVKAKELKVTITNSGYRKIEK